MGSCEVGGSRGMRIGLGLSEMDKGGGINWAFALDWEFLRGEEKHWVFEMGWDFLNGAELEGLDGKG